MSSTPFAESVYQPQDDGGQPGENVPDLAGAVDELSDDFVLDAGYSPPEQPRFLGRYGTTWSELHESEGLDRRILQEIPEGDDVVGDGLGDTSDTDGELYDDQVGCSRAGRLTADTPEFARDVGIDGGAASAEEAAMHIVDLEWTADLDA